MAAGSRDISLASVLNVRDLGGLTTSAGHRIRNRRLLRGAAPDRISSADLSLLTLQIGLSAFLIYERLTEPISPWTVRWVQAT
jgi:hypothetical protein